MKAIWATNSILIIGARDMPLKRPVPSCTLGFHTWAFIASLHSVWLIILVLRTCWRRLACSRKAGYGKTNTTKADGGTHCCMPFCMMSGRHSTTTCHLSKTFQRNKRNGLPHYPHWHSDHAPGNRLNPNLDRPCV